MPGEEPVLYEPAGALAWLRLNRPEVLNAISPEAVDEFDRCLDAAAADPDVRLVAITGEGRGFSSGADIHVMDGATPREFMAFVDRMNEVWLRIRSFPKPVVAALNGVTVGAGFELALVCDVRYATRGALIGSKESHINQPMTNGSTFLLPRLVGEGWAKQICLTGELLPAEDALRIGLVTRVFDDRPALSAAVEALADEVATGGPLAVSLIKRCLNETDSLHASVIMENEAATKCFVSEDQKEGLRAFLEKRAPRWTGR